jgi:hypothetical protein
MINPSLESHDFLEFLGRDPESYLWGINPEISDRHFWPDDIIERVSTVFKSVWSGVVINDDGSKTQMTPGVLYKATSTTPSIYAPKHNFFIYHGFNLRIALKTEFNLKTRGSQQQDKREPLAFLKYTKISFHQLIQCGLQFRIQNVDKFKISKLDINVTCREKTPVEYTGGLGLHDKRLYWHDSFLPTPDLTLNIEKICGFKNDVYELNNIKKFKSLLETPRFDQSGIKKEIKFENYYYRGGKIEAVAPAPGFFPEDFETPQNRQHDSYFQRIFYVNGILLK